MRRVVVYVDGFNLYHAIDNLRRPHLKWVDIYTLAESLVRKGEAVKAAKYFSAYATWKRDEFARHRAYVEALESRGVEVILGQFKQKPRRCRQCRAVWMTHEEKETDVQIATHMVADALTCEVDRLILVSADTDLAPPIRMIAQLAPQCEVFVAAPPARFRLCRALRPRLELSADRIARCLRPEVVQGKRRSVKRPKSYDPPA